MEPENIINLCKDSNEDYYLRTLKSKYVAENSFIDFYKKFEEEASYPDLFGKCVEVNSSQFKDLYNVISEISKLLGIESPRCFIKDSYSYTIESEGLNYPWLELSAKAYNDLSKKEISFLIAKELYHIANNHLYHEIMSEKMFDLINSLPNIPGINIISKFGGDIFFEHKEFQYRQTAFQWFRSACLSADNFALSYIKDLKSSIDAILLTVLNERKMVDQIDLKRYINQIANIETCLNPMATLEKINEVLPYGPYRMLNLLRFYLSENYYKLENNL